MKKKSNVFLCTIMLLLFVNTLSISALNIPCSNPYLKIDFENKEILPKNFRKSTDKISNSSLNTSGLDTLNISGSSQFTQDSFVLSQKNIGSNWNITVVDLRQESHGFINGTAVSWLCEHNDANKGLSLSEVTVREDEELSSIPLNTPLTFPNNITLTPKTVQNEKNLTKSYNASYFRVPVTDGETPTNEDIDLFLNFAKDLPDTTWLHFHCKHGIGRTTFFMIIYDMMHNSKDVPFNDIVNRQVLLGGTAIEKDYSKYNEKRMKLLSDFYNYTKSNKDNYKTTWSNWISLNHSSSIVDKVS